MKPQLIDSETKCDRTQSIGICFLALIAIAAVHVTSEWVCWRTGSAVWWLLSASNLHETIKMGDC